MKVIALRGFFVETGVKIRKGDVVDLPDDEANYLIDFKAAREATKLDEENFLNSDQVVSFAVAFYIWVFAKLSKLSWSMKNRIRGSISI